LEDHQSLAPYLVTIDGLDPPPAFYSKWTPWIATSPLMTSLTILSAAYYQSDIRGLDVTKSPEIFAIQGRIISVINDHLKRKKMKDLEYDVIAAVMYLAMNEVSQDELKLIGFDVDEFTNSGTGVMRTVSGHI
jgi:hypothetical protein